MKIRTIILLVTALFFVLLGISFLSIKVTNERIQDKEKSDSIKADSIKNAKMVEDFINHSKL